MQTYLSVLVLGDASRVSGANLEEEEEEEEEEEASSSSSKQILYSTNTLKHTLLILNYMINELVFIHSISLDKNFKSQ
jgi:hypothetical protein